MSKHTMIPVLIATLALSACATGVQSPVVRFDRQVSYGETNAPESVAKTPGSVDQQAIAARSGRLNTETP
jgi:hypothetical protein